MNLKENILKNKQKIIFAVFMAVTFILGLFLGLYQPNSTTQANITPLGNNRQYLPNLEDSISSNNKSIVSGVKEDCAIKGKTKRNGQKVYYLPEDKSFKRLKAYKCFQSEKDALSSGFIRYKKRK